MFWLLDPEHLLCEPVKVSVIDWCAPEGDQIIWIGQEKIADIASWIGASSLAKLLSAGETYCVDARMLQSLRCPRGELGSVDADTAFPVMRLKVFRNVALVVVSHLGKAAPNDRLFKRSCR